MTGEDGERAIDLLGQDDARELVRHGQRGKRKLSVSRRAAEIPGIRLRHRKGRRARACRDHADR